MPDEETSRGLDAIRVLVLEDRPTDAELMVRELRRSGFAPDATRVVRRAEFTARLDEDWDIILSDYNLPDMCGLDAADLARERKPDVPLVVVSGTVGDELAAECIKRGAHDYVLKEHLARLGPVVARALEAGRLRVERRAQRQLVLLQATALENAADAIVITNVGGVIEWVNPAFSRMTGYTADEVIGRTPRILRSGMHDQGFYERLWDTILSGETWRGSFVNRRRDGSAYTDEHTITPVRATGREVTHFIAIMHDVTDQQRAQARVRESEERFQLIARTIDEVFWVADMRIGKTVYLSDNFQRIWGLPPDEVLKDPASFIESIHPADRAAVEACIARQAAGVSFDHEYRIIRPDGSERWIRDRGYPVRDASGNVTHCVGAAMDVTEGKITQEALRTSEERFREVVENINEVFWMTDAKEKRLLYVSPGYHEVWGRPVADLYESPDSWIDSIHPEDRTRVLTAVGARHAAGDYDETYRIVRPDGSTRWIHERAFPVREDDGTVSRIVGVAEDVTENKKLEEQFLRSQRMEAIGTLAGGVAHDLNNILAPMLMVSSVLGDKLTDPEDRKLLAMIGTSAQRGSDIIRKLLAFSRGTGATRAGVQLRHLVKEIMEIMRETFPRQIEISASLDQDLWIVRGDATQLHQMLLNLCVNARDAMPDGGRLSLHGRNLEMDEGESRQHTEARPGKYIVFTVSDTGMGIPPEIRDRIFDPFFTTKKLGMGSGLGLSSVAGIVKGHGGFITVYSELSEGTSFHVYLPAEPGDAPVTTKPEGSPPPGHGELILVVEDEQNIRDAIAMILERCGYHAVSAANGKQALLELGPRLAETRLVITDIMMPEMDGFALIRALRNVAPRIPVIACSGLPHKEEIARLGDDRLAAFLAKPFDTSTLLREIDRVLHKRAGH